MRHRTIIAGLATLCFGCCVASAEYKLVWSDEFDRQNVCGDAWRPFVEPGVVVGANEVGHYTDRPGNLRTEDGNLVLSVRREAFDNHQYTCACIDTYSKQSFCYGRVEMRVKLPKAHGVRARISLLPEELHYGSWGGSGEIRLLECSGKATEYSSSLFFGGSGPRTERYFTTMPNEIAESLDDGFHIFSIEWQPYEIRWYVDGELWAVRNQWSCTRAKYPAPFDRPFYLSVGLAAVRGISLPASHSSVDMVVDWVRVYQAEGNRPPSVALVSPSQNDHLPASKPFEIQATASDPDGTLAKVEFYANDKLIGSDTQPPYSFAWPVTDGCYRIVARAVDPDGYVCADGVDVECGIGCPPTPFHGSPSVIPGRVEAEDFDESVKGEAYYDADPSNNGGAYRPKSGVDIQPCDEGGFDVCWMIDNEWMQYTVNVEKAGQYDIRCRVASPKDSARVRIEFDGKAKVQTKSLVVPQTGDWQRYTDLVAKGVRLQAGTQVMRFIVEKDGLNLNYIDVVPSGTD